MVLRFSIINNMSNGNNFLLFHLRIIPPDYVLNLAIFPKDTVLYKTGMYYSYHCSYCSKIFYTFNDNKEEAARILYEGIKKHLIEYGEDDREYEFDDYPEKEINEMYAKMSELTEPPSGAYELP